MGQSCCKKIPDMQINAKDNNICSDLRCHTKCLSTCCLNNSVAKKHHHHHHNKHKHVDTPIEPTVEIYG
jgi:hypothetical protein